MPRPVAQAESQPIAAPLPAPGARRAPERRPGASAITVIAADAALSPLRPRPRPGAAQRPRQIVSPLASAAPDSSLRPAPRPDNLRRRAAVRAAGFAPEPPPKPTKGRKGSVCGDPAIKGSEIAPIATKIDGCGLQDGVQITSVDGVALSTPAIMDCATATALKSWVATGLKPAVGRLGGGVASLQVAAHYTCRTRNNRPGERISEHGRGRAIDISAIVLANGVAISVLKGWAERQHGKILKAAHRAACGPFGTVLGPGADAQHRDHLHLDTARYRSGSYCR